MNLLRSLLRIYRTIKEVLIFLNLLFAAVLLGALLYFGAAVVSAFSHWSDQRGPVPVEQQQDAPPVDGNGCEEGQSLDSETGLCYPDGEVD